MLDGFIRVFQNEFTDIIPKELNQICFDYYFEEKERFDKEVSSPGHMLEISADGYTAEAIDDEDDLVTALGFTVIPSMNNDTIYQWTFDIKNQNYFNNQVKMRLVLAIEMILLGQGYKRA